VVLGGLVAAGLLLAVAQWDRLLGFEREQSAADTRRSGDMRLSFAYVSWTMFLDRPLWGCGFGQYPHAVLPYLADRSTELNLESIRGYSHHSTLLCLLVENGLLGLGLFLGLLAGWARAAWQVYRSPRSPDWARRHAVLLLGVLALYLVQALSHDVSYTAVENLFLFFLAGMTLGLRPSAERSAQPACAVWPREFAAGSVPVRLGQS
jgi:O-antigen ligase